MSTKILAQGAKFGSGATFWTFCGIGHRLAEQRIKSVLNVKQHKLVNDNSLNKLFLLICSNE